MSDFDSTHWTVLAPSAARGHMTCRCVCGAIKVVRVANVRAGLSKSCGCVDRPFAHRTHGMTQTPEYRAWNHMKHRCLNPNLKCYADYGGRGITVCERWAGPHGFAAFYADMGPRPSKKHSLERVRNEEGYCRENCVWALRQAQNQNRRSVRLHTHNGRTQCAAAWAAELGMSKQTIGKRLRKMSLSELIKKFGPFSVRD